MKGHKRAGRSRRADAALGLSLCALCALGAAPGAASAARKRAPAKESKDGKGAAGAAGAALGAYEGLVISCSKDSALKAEGHEGRGGRSGEWRDCEGGASLQTNDRARTGKAGLLTLALVAQAAPSAPSGPGVLGTAAKGAAKAEGASAGSPSTAASASGAAASAGSTARDSALARVWLDPGSQLQLLPATKKQPAGVALSEGAARLSSEPALAGKVARPLRIQLPDGELRLRGVARVELGPGAGDASIAIYDGQAELQETRGRRAVVKLAAGAGALLRRGGKLRSGGLIGAPSWEGEKGLYFALPQRGPATAVADVALPFRPVQGAVRYRVEVGKDEALLERLQATTLSAELRRAALRLPGRGRYFVRLQAVDSDQVAGPGPVQVVEVVEVRGERVSQSTLGGVGNGSAAPLLQGTGELAFELLSGGGRLQVQLDDKPVQSESQSPSYVQLKVGRGPHHVQVRSEGGYQGDLRVQVTRPSYEVELSQGLYAAVGRSYRVEVRALDGAGQKPAPVVGLSARTAVLQKNAQAQVEAVEHGGVTLVAKAPGIYQGELAVPSGQVLRLSIADADGPLVSTDLRGSPE